MKIIYASQIFLPLQKTRAIQVHRVASALHQAGVDIHLIVGLDRHAKKTSTTTFFQNYSFPVHFLEYGFSKSAKLRHWNELFHELLPRWSIRSPEFVRKALPLTVEIIKQNKPDLLLTSSTPIVSHFLGLRIKQIYPELPWVAFFSDTYPFGLRPLPYQRAKYAVPFQINTIKSILTQADAIATPSVRLGEWYLKTYGKWLSKEKVFSVRPCGSPQEQIERPPSIATSDIPEFQKMDQWMLHTGILDHYRLHPEMVRAISILRQKYPDEFKGLLCIGKNSPKFKSEVKAMGASDYIKTMDWRPLKEIQYLLTQSLCNCIIDVGGEHSYYLQSKMPDYVVAKRPIFSITAKVSVMRDFARQYENVIAVSPDVGEIVNAVEQLILEKRKGNTACELPFALVDHFSEQNVANLYIEIFQSVLRKKM